LVFSLDHDTFRHSADFNLLGLKSWSQQPDAEFLLVLYEFEWRRPEDLALRGRPVI
jgi:hypothetical protein